MPYQPVSVNTAAHDAAFALARQKMLEQQLRPWQVLSPQVLDLFGRLPREQFVAPEQRALAYADLRLPLPEGQQMLEPKEDARILQALAVRRQEVALEVGTGSGFFTACLASQAALVHSVDIFPTFKYLAQSRLQALELNNVILRTADAAQRYEAQSRYDVIVLTGAVYQVPEFYRQALSVGGRLLAIVGEAPAMQVTLFTRVGSQDFQQVVLFETVVPYLLHAEKPVQFVF
jgi:protein-L-isoaspartate(D-aspartate) O-methyltransferase